VAGGLAHSGIVVITPHRRSRAIFIRGCRGAAPGLC
jgi:hypothetical protein